MRVGVFGNCQAQSVAACVSVLAPECEVHHCSVNRATAASEDERRAHIDAFCACDYLLIQPSVKNDCVGFQATDFEAYCRNIVRLPLITSFSFHPDCHYLQDDSGRSLEGVLGPYHSAIAAGAFKAGLPAERAEKLFNAYTYRSLGYLDGMISNEPFALEARREGFDFEDFFRCKHGVYMHTINHPKMSIVLEMTRQALSKSGIKMVSDVAPPDDWQSRGSVWPVYPEIKLHLEVEDGEFFFNRPGKGVHLSLREFIDASYASYRTVSSFKSGPTDRVCAFIKSEVL